MIEQGARSGLRKSNDVGNCSQDRNRELENRIVELEARVETLARAFSRERYHARRRWLRPPLWVHEQYEPRQLCVKSTYPREEIPVNAASIAIVTPTLNRCKYLRATIDSVLTHGYPRLNYRVQDGGSTDGTMDLLRSYRSQLTWRSERDNGQAQAINRAFSACNGDIMAYLNSDDMLLPGTLGYVARA